VYEYDIIDEYHSRTNYLIKLNMAFPLLTTHQYDATKYTPVGTVVVNRVESISLLRSAFAGLGAAFGGKNTLIQTAVNNLQARSMAEFTAKVQSTYPNTVQVVALQTDVSEVGRDESATFMVMTMSGTCLVPLGQTGGARRRTLRNRRGRRAASRRA
jgi:uncharacterized protein YbjQ (UPF0145 family)